MGSIRVNKRSGEYPNVLDLQDLQNNLSEAISGQMIDDGEWSYYFETEDYRLASYNHVNPLQEFELNIYSHQHPDAEIDHGFYVEEKVRLTQRPINIRSISTIALCLAVLGNISPGDEIFNPVALVSIDLPFWIEIPFVGVPILLLLFTEPWDTPVITETIPEVTNISIVSGRSHILQLVVSICSAVIVALAVLFTVLPYLAVASLFLTITVSALLSVKPSTLEKLEDISYTIKSEIPSLTVLYVFALFMPLPGLAWSYGFFIYRPQFRVLLFIWELGIIMFVVFTLHGYCDIFSDMSAVNRHEFIESRKTYFESYTRVSRKTRIFMILVMAVYAYVMIAFLVNFLVKNPYTGRVLFFGPIFLFGFFIAGFTYQTIIFISTYTTLLKSEEFEAGLDIDIEGEVRVSKSIISANAVTTGFSNYILISETVAEKYDSDILSALIAHEDSHIRNRDTHLSSILWIISPLIFIGVNLLLILFNFTEREIRTDREAARKVGKETYIEALRAIDDETESPEAKSNLMQTGFYPISDYYPIGKIQATLGLFFGSFGLTQAHPPNKKRIELLQSL